MTFKDRDMLQIYYNNTSQFFAASSNNVRKHQEHKN